MAINKPIIDAGPTHTREQVKTVIGCITSVAPPGLRQYVEDGVVIVEDQVATREGQVLFYRDGSSLTVQIYVVVEVDGAFVWKTVLPTAQMQNGANGQKWDPLASFYDPLVS